MNTYIYNECMHTYLSESCIAFTYANSCIYIRRLSQIFVYAYAHAFAYCMHTLNTQITLNKKAGRALRSTSTQSSEPTNIVSFTGVFFKRDL